MKNLVKESLEEFLTEKKGTVELMDDLAYQTPRWDSMSQQESSDEKSSFETIDGDEAVKARRVELKEKGYHIKNSKASAGFTAKKDDERIVVRLK